MRTQQFNHTTALLGEQIYMFGGSSAEDSYYKDIYILDTGTLAWQKCEVKGDSPSGSVSQTFTAHYDKDIYLFGGRCESKNGTTTNEIQKLSIVMKEILSEFGIQGVSNGFAPTKVPKAKYELTESPFPARIDSPPPIQVADHRDFNTVRNEAMEMVTRAFAIVDNAFQKLDNEKSELFQATIAFQYEKEAYNTQRQKQQQELKEMLEKHKAQNEAWLKARAEENDRERKELCKLRVELHVWQGDTDENVSSVIPSGGAVDQQSPYDSPPAEREPGEVVDSLVGKQVEYAKEDGSKRTGMVIHQVEAKPSVYFIKFDDDFHIYVYDLVKTS
ncbi:UNVERIFIED_CONTAM: hypothetical protein FKN15_053640 [Acipenser sinensis]